MTFYITDALIAGTKPDITTKPHRKYNAEIAARPSSHVHLHCSAESFYNIYSSLVKPKTYLQSFSLDDQVFLPSMENELPRALARGSVKTILPTPSSDFSPQKTGLKPQQKEGRRTKRLHTHELKHGAIQSKT